MPKMLGEGGIPMMLGEETASHNVRRGVGMPKMLGEEGGAIKIILRGLSGILNMFRQH